LWDRAKIVLGKKFVGINTYIKKLERSLNNLILCLKEMEKEEQTKTLFSKGNKD
jgi:hypothetical protein